MIPRHPFLFVFFILTVLSPKALPAQEGPCTLKLIDLSASPELRGFRLGMTKDEVKARVPQVVFGKTDDLGVSKTTINPYFDPAIDKSSFSGVRSISLDFLDARLSSLWFGFDNSFKWKTVDQFVSGISEALRLPNMWQAWRTRGKQIKCADFSMTVMMLGEGASFRILDDSADDLIAERRSTLEEQKTAAEEGATEPPIVGDMRTKTYYLARCFLPNSLNKKDRALFSTISEAENAGYKKARDCAHEN